VIVHTKSLKKSGFEKPKNKEILALKKSMKPRKSKVVINKLINEVETIFPLSFSFEKNRKKAVSIP